MRRPSAADRRWRRTDAAVPPLALLERQHGFEQVTTAEIRPQRLGHVDFGVGNLPEQVVADAHLAAGADQQIWIRLPCGVEKAGESRLVEFLGSDAGPDGA